MTLTADVKKRIIVEIGKDLTRRSVDDIEGHLTIVSEDGLRLPKS